MRFGSERGANALKAVHKITKRGQARPPSATSRALKYLGMGKASEARYAAFNAKVAPARGEQ